MSHAAATKAPVVTSRKAQAGPVRTMIVNDGTSHVAVMIIDQRHTRLVWHPGKLVPGGLGWPTPDQLGGIERRNVLATFNGGFMNLASRGGIRAGGASHGALRTGAAALVLNASGRADVVAYDPLRDHAAAVIRENLDLLVDGGRVVARADEDDTSRWGKTLHHRHATWRTGVGILANGRLVVVLGDALTTRALGDALVLRGATRGMELDINPQFTALLTYEHTTGTAVPRAVLPSEQGSARRYLRPSNRDFFSVLPR